MKFLEKLVFTKVELWVVFLIVLGGIVALPLFGALVREAAYGPTDRNVAEKVAYKMASFPGYLSKALEVGLEWDDGRLVGKSRQVLSFDAYSGFHQVDSDFQDNGILFISAYSQEAKQPIFYLLDLTTQERLWKWVPNFGETGEWFDNPKEIRRNTRNQHPLLLEDGSVVFLLGESHLVKIDKSGDIIWANTRRHFHHSLELTPDGQFPSSFGQGMQTFAMTAMPLSTHRAMSFQINPSKRF